MSATTKTEFVSAEFETEVSDERLKSPVTALDEAVGDVRERPGDPDE